MVNDQYLEFEWWLLPLGGEVLWVGVRIKRLTTKMGQGDVDATILWSLNFYLVPSSYQTIHIKLAFVELKVHL